MASIQQKGESFYCQFLYHGKRHTFTVGKVSADEAEAKGKQVDYLLMRLKQRLIQLPAGVDVVTFVQFDGAPPQNATPHPEKPRMASTLGVLRDRYLATLGNGTIEANSLYTLRIHLQHACRILGEDFPTGELTLANLQGYVDARTKKVSAYTIRKEVRSLKAAWSWGSPMNLTSGTFPSGGIRYPKQDAKPPFMTREEIERQLAAGGDPDVLWDSLYLQTRDVAELLGHVERAAAHPWIYPLVCFAAHTGSRRSEIIRAVTADVDFASNTVLIREKKRCQGHRTHRRMPMTPFLKRVLKTWLKAHPGGSHLFCHAGTVHRSKKRSVTTGHLNDKIRPSAQRARLTTVRKREDVPQGALTRDEVHDHFKRTLRGSRWEVLRGLHCLRHSFISACASKGLDQRLVQEWCGHMDEATSERYRHLWPSVQQAAISAVFSE